MSRDKKTEIKEMAQIIAKNIYGAEQNADFAPNAKNASKELYAIGYRKASDVAREIFAEIEKHKTIPFGSKCEVVPFYVIADLKKKYESEGAE